MFFLTIRPPAERDRVPPDPSRPGVEVWQDVAGRPVAFAERSAGRCTLQLPRIATFEFGAGSDEVVAVPARGAAAEVVADQYFRTVLPFVLQDSGFEVLHASAVRAPGGVAALCARQETGKSTLACALGKQGYELWADDAVVFDVRGVGQIFTLQVPFSLRLRPASAAHFGLPAASRLADIRCDSREPLSLAERAPLATLVVLERDESLASPAELRRLTTGAAFPAVLAHAYCFTLEDGERKERMMKQYLSLLARIPVFELRFRSGLEQLPAILERVRSAIEQSRAHDGLALPR